MSEYVLFSSLGMTDPSRGMRDGAFIHICRFYKPGKAYLYMTKEIYEYDIIDNRYVEYLNRLCRKLGFVCETEKIIRKDLTDVSEFDWFYKEFRNILGRIVKENPGKTLLVNVSSGTTQMKAALFNICSILPMNCTLIKVSTPVLGANRELIVGEKYDIDLEWEYNEDNVEENPPNRCAVVEYPNFNALIKTDIIRYHIQSYDYLAALTVAETIKDLLPEKCVELIRVGVHRLALDLKQAESAARRIGYELLPVNEKTFGSVASLAFEYLLALSIKLKKGDLADFVRGISPLLTDLFIIYLEKKCSIRIDQYCSKNSRNAHSVKVLRRDLLPEDFVRVLDKAFSETYKNGPLSAAVLLPIISEYGDSRAVQLASELRHFEETARNMAAHEIVSVSDKWLKNTAGFTSQEIHKRLIDFFLLSVSVPKDAWRSYDKLNEQINSLLLGEYING